MINIAVAGSGLMANIHAVNFNNIPGVSVAAVYSDDPSTGKKLAEETGAEFLTGKKGLYSNNIDAVCIAVPTGFHAEYSIEALDNKKHVFLEKPLARSVEDGRRIVNKAESSGKICFTGHVLRFFPEYVRVKALIDNGEAGNPGVARFSRGGCDPGGVNNWYKDYAKSGGVILDLSIHDIDFARWCFGDVDEVYAKSMTKYKYENIDYALIIMRHKSGVISHIEGSWVAWESFKTSFEIAGSEGILHFDSTETQPVKLEQVQENTKRPDVEVPVSPMDEDPYLTEVKHFINCIRNDRKSGIVSPEESLKTLETTLAAVKSAETGLPVKC